MNRFLRSTLMVLLIWFSAGWDALWAKNSSELIYTEPFDLASGGTTLTRASQEGIVFANPALLPLGGAYVRWIGLQLGVIADTNLANSKSTKLGEGDQGNVANTLLSRSLHLGQTATLSLLNKNFAFSVFDRIEVDAAGSRFADGGLPAIEFGVEAYGGGLLSFATRPTRWFSVGMTAKYIFVGEPSILVPLADQEKIKKFAEDPQALKGDLKYGKGMGGDVGSLFLWQNPTVDLSLGLKVEDLGGTHIDNGQETIPQTIHTGLGLAIHGSTEVLHLSLDYRDAANAYTEEKTFKKIYMGARLMIRQRLGFAVGLYQGIPTVGLRLDAFLFKIGLTAYGRELGQYPGEKQRNLVMLYTSLGF